jgi:thioredoxin reductase
MKSIAIVGAGLRGLCSAAYLRSVGHTVSVFDAMPRYGGIWNRVTDDAQINTPYYGYTFHATNVWTSHRPAKLEILANLERMVAAEGLADIIRLNDRIDSVSHAADGCWRLNGRDEPFDAILVCSGFLDRRKSPNPEMVAGFEGLTPAPYSFDHAILKDRDVTIVGSGPTALDMVTAARNQGAKSAHLVVKPGTQIADIGLFYHAIHAIKSNPLLYRSTKRKGATPGIACKGIREVLDDPRVSVHEASFREAQGRTALLSGGETLPTDVLIWCTGWDSPIPRWTLEHRDEPSLVVAACPSCLDTAGFGYGAATAHAKALHAALICSFDEQFRSGSAECDCRRVNVTFSRHIILNLILYYLRNPGGARLLRRELAAGFRSNRVRWNQVNEPRWSTALAFFNAPLGF